MASSLNRVMLIGNLGKDAETRHTPSGKAVTNFSVATTFRVKDSATGEWKDKTDWHDVVLWGAERVTQYLTKGQKVFVEGRLQTRSWEGPNGEKRYRTEVVCDSSFGLMLLGARGSSGDEGGSFNRGGSRRYDQHEHGSSDAAGRTAGQPAPTPEPATAAEPPPDDEDIPF